MDIARAFTYVTEDEEWLPVVLIGGLLLLIPLFGQIVLIGFLLEAARNVAMGSPRPLPKWNNLGEKFRLGLNGFAIQIVYSLPIILLTLLFVCIIAGVAISADGDESAIGGVVALFYLCLFPLIMLLSLIIQPLMLTSMVRYLQTGSLGAALRVGEVFTMFRSNLGTWLILWLLQLLCGFVAGFGVIAFGIGVLFTTVYAQAVFGHLMGQELARSMTPGGSYAPAPPAPMM